MKKRVISAVMCLVFTGAMLVGCTSNPGADSDSAEESAASVSETTIINEGDPIVLASMTDEESQIYGEIMKQALIAGGFEVDASGVGTYNNTTLPRQSLMEDQIDLVMDYTGRGMMFISDVDSSLYTTDLETAFQTTKEADAENGLVWMCYSPYNNTDGLCVRQEWAEENNIKDFNDLADYLNNGGEFKLAIATEYSYVATAETCLPGWEETYGFKLSDDQLVIGVSEPQNMVSNATDGITASNCYTTGGALEALGLYVIEDPEFVSPIYSPAAVARQEVIDKYPELQEILEPVFAAIDDETVRDMNKRLQTDGESAADIATQFLQDNGFIK